MHEEKVNYISGQTDSAACCRCGWRLQDHNMMVRFGVRPGDLVAMQYILKTNLKRE